MDFRISDNPPKLYAESCGYMPLFQERGFKTFITFSVWFKILQKCTVTDKVKESLPCKQLQFLQSSKPCAFACPGCINECMFSRSREAVLILHSWQLEGWAWFQSPHSHWAARGHDQGREGEEECGQELYGSSLNNLSGLWGIRAVSNNLVPPPELISGPGCEGPVEEVVGNMDSALVGLHVKDLFTGESFTISRNWLTLMGEPHWGQQDSKCQSIRIQEIKRYGEDIPQLCF